MFVAVQRDMLNKILNTKNVLKFPLPKVQLLQLVNDKLQMGSECLLPHVLALHTRKETFLLSPEVIMEGATS